MNIASLVTSGIVRRASALAERPAPTGGDGSREPFAPSVHFGLRLIKGRFRLHPPT